jgi:hypothetical protein
MGHTELELLTPEALQSALGSLACDVSDFDGRKRDSFMAMVTIRVRDLAATERALQHGGFSARELRAGIAVPADARIDRYELGD